MRQPGQGVPVPLVKGRERPLHRVPRQTTLNMGILHNVGQVIEIDELVVDDGIVESERDGRQQKTKDDEALFAGR